MGFRAAVTTSDGRAVDLHFGRAKRFLIIDVDDDATYRVVEWRDAPASDETADGCLGRFSKIAGVLTDAEYVLTAMVGPKAHRALKAAGITVLESPEDLQEALEGLAAYRQRQRIHRMP